MKWVFGMLGKCKVLSNHMVSTYKFKRAFFRHDRRTAPKFGTHVRIRDETGSHQNKFTNPTPEGFRGLFIDVCGMWVCGMFVGGLWHDSSRW